MVCSKSGVCAKRRVLMTYEYEKGAVLLGLDEMRRSGIDRLFGQSVDKFHHFIVVMLYDARALRTHHILRVALALTDSRQDSLLCRVRVADAAVDKDPFNELSHLLSQLFIGDWLVEEGHEFLVRALETAEQLVSYEFGRYFLAWDVRGSVGLRHRTTL